MAGHRVPTAMKKAKGTYRPGVEVPNHANATGLPPVVVPQWVAGSQRAEELYYQLISHLQNMRVLSEEDDLALAMLASALEEIEVTTAMIEDEGRFYTTSNKGGDKMIRSHPAVAQRADAMRRALALLNDFGLTPASRAKVQVRGNSIANPFEALDQ